MNYIPPETETSALRLFFTSWSSIFTISIALALVIHKVLVHLDYPILSLFELCWNGLVYVMPAQVISALDSRFGSPNGYKRNAVEGSASRHAEKSEILRNVFRLDGASDTAKELVKLSPGPRGLGNWDNSCFQNSVLQALSSLSAFRDFLDQFSSRSNELSDSSLLPLLELTRNLNDRSESCKHLWTPAKLKSMNSWQQQDAQEYFSKIMDQLENDVKGLLKKEVKPGDPGFSQLLKLSKTEAPNALSSSTQESMNVNNPVDGLLAQRVGCLQCGYAEGISLIPFNCLTLPLGKQPAYDIRDCLDAYTDLELIEGVECGKCTLLRASKQLQHLLSTLSDSTSMQHAAYTVRLQAITNALETSSFSDATLTKTCQIPAKLRVTSTKTRQAVVMRQPKCLVLHVNRSVFDEYTGDLLKNYASVSFPAQLDLSGWACGGVRGGEAEDTPVLEKPGRASHDDEPKSAPGLDLDREHWQMDPAKSMLPPPTTPTDSPSRSCLLVPPHPLYSLQALIAHQGRHENGHYICYRKLPSSHTHHNSTTESELQNGQWWRLSDEQVREVSESEVLAQGGVFMLFYERVDVGERVEERKDSGTGSGAESGEKVESDGVDETLDEQSDPDLVSPPITAIHERNEAQNLAREDHELD